MGGGARQLGRAAGVELGEKESRGYAGGSGERKGKRVWKGFVIVSVSVSVRILVIGVGGGAMRELRKRLGAVDGLRQVQSRHVLRTGVSACSL